MTHSAAERSRIATETVHQPDELDDPRDLDDLFALADELFSAIVHDIALLSTLGVKLVLVHGSRRQVEESLLAANVPSAHCVQIVCPVELVAMPSGHCEHDTDCVCALK